MRRPALTALVCALIGWGTPMALGATPALAGGIPDGCTTDALHIDFANDVNENDVFHVHRVGDQMQIGVDVSNDAAGACSVDDATVTVQVPKPDGTPGPTTTIATGQSFPAGMPTTELSTTAPYTVAFDPGVFRGVVDIAITGTIHLAGGDAPEFTALSTHVVVSKPHATLTVTPSVSSGAAPLSVTYHYTLTNDSPADPDTSNPTPILESNTSTLDPDGSFLSDDTCSPIVYTGGDTHVTDPAEIDPGESWTFTCTRLFSDFGTFADHVGVAGFSSRDGRPWPVTVATSSVTAMAPDLTIAGAHTGTFTQGDSGRTYTLTATNAGNAATTTAPAVVTDTLPTGLTATAITGSGWTCTLGTLSCTRTDPLAAGASYPPITLTTNVAANAPAGDVVNTATISGGGELDTTDDSASDATTIAAPPVVVVPAPAPTAPVLGAAQPPAAIGTPLAGSAPASNRFTIRRVVVSKRAGTATITLSAPGPGVFTLTGSGATRATVPAKRAGTVAITLKPTAKARRTLKRHRKLALRVTLRFAPHGGSRSTQHRGIILRLAG